MINYCYFKFLRKLILFSFKFPADLHITTNQTAKTEETHRKKKMCNSDTYQMRNTLIHITNVTSARSRYQSDEIESLGAVIPAHRS